MQNQKLKSFEIVALEISFLIHATEDRERVLNLVSSFMNADKEGFEVEKLLGHWRNQIDMVKGKLEGELARNVATNILSSLEPYDRKKMLYSLGTYIDDKGILHLRLDKQKICERKIELSDVDSIKIKFKPKLFFSRIKQDYIHEYRRLLD